MQMGYLRVPDNINSARSVQEPNGSWSDSQNNPAASIGRRPMSTSLFTNEWIAINFPSPQSQSVVRHNSDITMDL